MPIIPFWSSKPSVIIGKILLNYINSILLIVMKQIIEIVIANTIELGINAFQKMSSTK
jgi:hypothetical protein